MATELPVSSAVAPSPSGGAQSVSEHTLNGLAYSRAAGIAGGIFLLIWAPLFLIRWPHHGITPLLIIGACIAFIFGLLLVLPWKRIESTPLWWPLYFLLLGFGVLFAFTCVIDLIYQYMLVLK